MKWYKRLFRYPELWVLTAAALLTRLWQLDVPRALVFDEVYFRKFAADYVSGSFFFDIHPPFVKLIFAGIGTLFRLSADQIQSGDPGGMILRVLPALAGAALVPLMYVIIRQFGLGRRIAAFGALLVLADNALLVESRFVLMDSLLLLFGMGAVSAYWYLRRVTSTWRWLWVVIVAVLLGMLVSTKWTGLAIAGLLFATWMIDSVVRKAPWQRIVGEGVLALAIMATIYISSFALNFTLLTKSGEGDAFMSERFQSTLVGSKYYDANARMSLWDKIVELNTKMYTAQSTLEHATHPYATKWYSWPLEIRGVYYWEGAPLKNGAQGNIYLLGNPVVWWLSTIGVLAALIIWLAKPRLLGRRHKQAAFLLVGYALNFIPFAFIDRPMFLYHYLFALLFAILLTCVMLAQLFDWQQRKYGRKTPLQLYWLLVMVVILGFLYFLPLSYGWPMSPSDLQMHMWLPSWR